MVNNLKALIYLFITVSLLSANSAWAEVRAFLNQNTYFEGDPVTLTIEANTNSQAEPDLSPLQKDFDLIGRSTSTQVNIHNGHKRVKKSWTVELQPRNKGEIQIPAIQVGQETSNPVTLKISQIPEALKKETSKHVFIESSVDLADKSPYVQQQIPYTVRLYYDSAMKNGKIFSPTVENAVVEQLGEDRRYRTVRRGKKYSVIEKHFVISPEKSGPLHIPPTTVKGRLSVEDNRNKQQNRRRDNTDFMNRFFNNSPFDNDPFFRDFGGGFFSNRSGPSKPFTANSEAIDVDVQPIPKEFKGDQWLPAEDLIIEDSWTKQPPDLKVGEPVTRTLVIQAKGLAGSQIPDIRIPKPDNMRMYPEPGKSDTRTDGKTVYGLREMNITYIPDAEGKATIPEIKLDWWNVLSKKQQTFTLPKWTLNVAPGSAPSSADKQNQAPAAAVTDSNNTTATGNPETIQPAAEVSKPKKPLWRILIGLALLIAALAYFFWKKRNKQTREPQTSRSDNSRDNKKTRASQQNRASQDRASQIARIKESLQQACQNNDKQNAAQHLLTLAQASWNDENPPQNLADLANQVTQGQKEIRELERALYANDASASAWNGEALWDAVKDGIQQMQQKKQEVHTDLKPLYPV